MGVEVANYEIFIKNDGKIHITLDAEYKGRIKIQVKDRPEGILRIPIELDEESVKFLEENGFGEVHERCGFNISM